MVGAGRLDREDVERRAGERTRRERVGQRVLVDQRRARGVDEAAPRLHARQLGARRGARASRPSPARAGSRSRSRARSASSATGSAPREHDASSAGTIRVVHEDAAPKPREPRAPPRGRPRRSPRARSSAARARGPGSAVKAWPMPAEVAGRDARASRRNAVARGQLAREREQEGEGEVGDGVGVAARRVQHGHAVARSPRRGRRSRRRRGSRDDAQLRAAPRAPRRRRGRPR